MNNVGPDGGYQVLDTDYVTYAAVYDCVTAQAFKVLHKWSYFLNGKLHNKYDFPLIQFEYAWLLSRTNVMTDANLARARQAYTNQGVDVGQFNTTVQGGTCRYEPIAP